MTAESCARRGSSRQPSKPHQTTTSFCRSPCQLTRGLLKHSVEKPEWSPWSRQAPSPAQGTSAVRLLRLSRNTLPNVLRRPANRHATTSERSGGWRRTAERLQAPVHAPEQS
ncbi:hypothetical protein WJX72_003100 [[Myrmecia] bisecta]|uniref:Uncharacterized protein n=1 Tax=[Myrmecia] bisecta TaxID=41462 RepID=A0AAW1QQX7_9CHLO